MSALSSVSSQALGSLNSSLASSGSSSSSTTNSGNSNGLTFSGLSTGLDTASIIQGLTSLNQKQIINLQAQQATIAAKQAAFTALKGQLQTLQSSIATLAASTGGAFDGNLATSSNTSVLTATAGSSAVAGNYSVTVNSLAQSEQVASAGFADANTALQQGSLTIQVGNSAPITVNVTSQNNTLQGLANTINSINGGVTASVINDGSASPFRLLLTSNATGAANTINITNNLSGTGAAIDPANTVIQAATDASVSLGSGSGKLTVTNPSNTINNLVPGVTLNLQAVSPNTPINLNVAPDTTTAVKDVTDFVNAYNAVQTFISTQSSFDPKTGQAGPLLGNTDLANLSNSLANAISTIVPGAASGANSLSSLGISFNADGTLALNQKQLTSALSGSNGTTLASFKQLFGLTGTSDTPGVSFILGSNATSPSGSNPYQAVIDAPATRATVLASGPPAASVVITPANNTLQLKVNQLAAEGITIPSGTYTVDQLASIIQQKLNTGVSNSNNLVAVGVSSGGALQITSQLYGAASSISSVTGSAAADLGFTGNEAANGTDVVGHFVVNGKTEPANGSGQLLTGPASNSHTAGLALLAQVSAPTTANVTVSQGLASHLNNFLAAYLNPATGTLQSINSAFTQQTNALSKTIANDNATLATKTAQLQAQFASMEKAVQNIKSVGASLASLITTSTTS